MATQTPTRLVLVPLPDFVHFPQTHLRLDFSAEDRPLVERIFLGDGDEPPAVGTVLLKPAWARDEDAVEVFSAGTAGRLIDFESLPDGGCRVLIYGEYRFEVRRELGRGPLREALVEPLKEPYLSDVDPEVIAVRDDLVHVIGTLAEQLDDHFPLSHEQLSTLRDDDVPFETFVNSVAASLDVSPIRKLALLADALPERARNLLAILKSRQTILELLRPYRHLARRAAVN